MVTLLQPGQLVLLTVRLVTVQVVQTPPAPPLASASVSLLSRLPLIVTLGKLPGDMPTPSTTLPLVASLFAVYTSATTTGALLTGMTLMLRCWVLLRLLAAWPSSSWKVSWRSRAL